MKGIKKLFAFVLSLALLQIVAIPAHARGTLLYWYCDTDEVAYIPSSINGSYFVYDHSGDEPEDIEFKTYFRNAVTTARNQWNNTLPLNIVETATRFNAKNFIHGGTYDQLKGIFEKLSRYNSGYTNSRPGTRIKTMNPYVIWCFESVGEMCVVERDDRVPDNYTKTALHEMGHLCGWLGHSTQDTDVMYESSSTVTTLTFRDKNQLKQIYDLYY